MSATGLQSIDHSIQLTHEWINDVMMRLDWDNKSRAYRLLRETLHALRDWLTVNEAAHLSAQMPIVLRGVFFEGWRPAETPVADRSKKDFIERIAKSFRTDPLDEPEDAVRAVFFVLNNHISKGEIQDVRNSLQKPLRDLWPN